VLEWEQGLKRWGRERIIGCLFSFNFVLDDDWHEWLSSISIRVIFRENLGFCSKTA